MPRAKKLAVWWVSQSYHHPWRVLSGAFLITLVCLWLSSGLKIRGDFASLLPDDYPSVKGFTEITKTVGGLGFTMVVVEHEDPKVVEQLTRTLAPRFRKLTDVIKAVQIHKVPPFVRDRVLYLAKDKDIKKLHARLEQMRKYIRQEARKRNPLVVDLLGDDDEKIKAPNFDDLFKGYGVKKSELKGNGLLGTPDGKLAVLLLQATGSEIDIAFNRKLREALQSTVAATLAGHPEGKEIKISYTGRYFVRLEDDERLKSQIGSVTGLSLLGILLLLFLATRRKRSFLLIGTPLLMGVVWAGGVTRLFNPSGEINFMTAFIVAVLLGLGIDFGIHLFSRYKAEREAGEDLIHALEQCLLSTGGAGIIAVGTSATAFFIIQLTDFKGLSQFGQVAGIGLVVILVTMMLVFPSIAVLLERNSPLLPQLKAAPTPIPKLAFLTHPITWGSGLLFGGIMLAGAVGILAFSELGFEYDLWRLITQGPAVKTYDRLKKNVFFGELEPGVIMFKDQAELRRVQAQLEKEKAAGKWKMLRTLLSLQSLVPPPKEQARRYKQLQKMQRLLAHKDFRKVPKENQANIRLLRKMVSAKPFTRKQLPKELTAFFGGHHPLLFAIPAIDPTEIRNAIRYADALLKIKAQKTQGKALVGDSNLVIADIFRLMWRDGPRAVLFALLGILFVLLIAFRAQWDAILLVLCPLVVGFAMLLTFMWLLGVKLNPFNIVMLPVTLGIGIDHGVYIYFHWNEEGRQITPSIKKTFSAVLLASLTSLIGFGSLTAAQHPGIYSIGLLAALGIFCCTFTAFVVMPSLFAWLQRSRSQPSE